MTFYRAMLCIARTMPSQDVCLSVCPSVTRRYSVETAKHILKLFLPSGSHTILVFPHHSMPIFRQVPPNGGVERYEKIDFFDQWLASSLK